MIRYLIAGILCAVVSVCAAAPPDQYELNIIRHASQDGDSGAQMLYGLALLEGRYGLRPDYPKAVGWLKLSARGGNHYAQLILGNCYASGKGVKQSAKQAARWWQMSAQGGNAKAQYHLGKAYLEGVGVAHNAKKAINWLTQSAQSGNHHAQYLIGKMYHEGYVVAQNHGQARDWLSRAAANGHTEAINLLGLIDTLYKDTTVVQQQSFDALNEKASAGDPEAQYELGLRYKSGAFSDKLKPNPEKALYWLKQAANNGNLLAMKALSALYSSGFPGLEKDLGKAKYWRDKSRGRH